jgi:hypothetical protein
LLSHDFSVQQNKDKPKKGVLPADMMESGRYHASVTTEDVWICYPWEAKYVPPSCSPTIYRGILWMLTIHHFRDIDEHDALAKENPII